MGAGIRRIKARAPMPFIGTLTYRHKTEVTEESAGWTTHATESRLAASGASPSPREARVGRGPGREAALCRLSHGPSVRCRVRWRARMKSTVTIIWILATSGLTVYLALERQASLKLEWENNGLRERLSLMDK